MDNQPPTIPAPDAAATPAAPAKKKSFFTTKRLVITAALVFGGAHLINDVDRGFKLQQQEELIQAQDELIQEQNKMIGVLGLENLILKDAIQNPDGIDDEDDTNMPGGHPPADVKPEAPKPQPHAPQRDHAGPSKATLVNYKI